VGAVRFRARSPLPTAHAALAPHVPLRFEVIDTWKSQFLGGMIYHTDPVDATTLPASPEAARSRFQQRFTPVTEGAVPEPLPPLVVHPEAPMTLDLRLVQQRGE
jgi:uncharacterized protein (DUF2126 family)